jgi:hypothetical protein
MITAQTAFENLEPNHSVHERFDPNGDRVVLVVCPFTDPSGAHYESPWDAEEGEPWMVNCLYCEFLNGGWEDHGCADTGDREIDDP